MTRAHDPWGASLDYDPDDDPPPGFWLASPPPASNGDTPDPSPAREPRRAKNATKDEDTFDDVFDEPLGVVLDDLVAWLAAHVSFATAEHAVAIALWAAHTHCVDRAGSTPRLSLESAEPESGKTRVLELLEPVVHRGRLVLQLSPAALYRWVAAVRPTILLDEVDAVFGPKADKAHEDLRALINAGHRPGATVPRVETPSMKVVEFSCFSPVALAGLAGHLPDTVRSRSIRIPMRRRAPGEQVRPFREKITRPEGEEIGRRLAAWMHRHNDLLPETVPLPEGVADRQADQWEPLLMLADAAGDHWPATARLVCVAMVTEARAATDDQSAGVRLLGDIRTVVAGKDRISTSDLLAGLTALDDAPWAGWLEGKGDQARATWLARKLKPYGVRPGDVRFTDGTRKGYMTEHFADPWRRYLPDRGDSRNKGNSPASDVAPVALVAPVRQER